MALLEVVAGGSDPLKIAFEFQRQELQKHIEVVTVDISSASRREKEKVFQAAARYEEDKAPRAVLLRGLECIQLAVTYLPKVALFVDHCTPMEVGSTSPLRRDLFKANRVYCYSQKSESEIRKASMGRVTVIPGPVFPPEQDHTPNEKPVIAFLDSCSNAIQVMARVLKVSKDQGWKYDAISPMRHSKATQVEDNLEAVGLADLVVAPNEDMDFGHPHDGAILASWLCKPLVTTRSDAFNVMGYPSKNFIAAKKYQIGTYAAAVGTYLRNRAKYDEWAGSTQDPNALVTDLLERIS